MVQTPRILIVDIETAPNLAHVWGLWQQNVGLPQLLESGEVICFAAKWHGEKKSSFYSKHYHSREHMLAMAHHLLDEADIVVHYNGKRFDIPWLNAEFAREGWDPPSPFQQVDLLQVVKKEFRFPSNKLDYVSQALGLGAKTSHTGHQLWLDCMAGKESAWKLMRKYNRQDVALTEKLYDRLVPWIRSHPAHGVFTGMEHSCPQCGSTSHMQKQGLAYTAQSAYQRYRCAACGKWSRDTRRLHGVRKKGL